MKQSIPFTLSVPQPCTQSWEKMTAADQGRFCQQCQKTVIDFSMMNDQQIIALISASGGSLCGRFEPSQLNREYRVTDPIKRRPYLPWAFIASALALVLPTSKVRSTPMMEQVAGEKADTVGPSPTGDTLRYVKGVVRDEDNTPLAGCTVMVKNTNTGIITDSAGHFSLKIPSHFKNSVTLVFRFVGFVSKEMNICPSTEMTEISLSMNPQILGEMVIIRCTPKIRWQRFKYRLLHPFSR
jgi:hypothetical protein